VNANAARRRFRLYVWTVFAGGATTLLALHGGALALGAAFDTASYFALWATMVIVAATSPLPLPWGGATASLTPALDFAAILVFGPNVACWIAVGSRLVTQFSRRWNPLLPGVQSLGQAILAVGAAGAVYAWCGGGSGTDLVVDETFAGALGAAFATYVIVKGLVAGLGAALCASAHRGRAFTRAVALELPGDLLTVPVGPLLALTQVRIGAVGVALFLLPLVFARYVVNLWTQTKSAHLHMIRTLMSAVDAADPFTRDHSYRVSRMSLRVGRHMGMNAAALEELEFAGLLHDIGRTAIQRDILIKRGKLTEQEMVLLRVHPQIGADLLAGLRFFPGAAEIVLCHHEQPDGKGYPRGLVGEAVPVGARIIMAVAAFDAMTSDRPYRRGLSPDAALEELLAHSGTQFFPDVVEGLIHLYASGELFAEFDAAHLDRYRAGAEHSRAIEEWLKAQDAAAGVPEKAGLRATPATPGRRVDALPVIELPTPGAAPAASAPTADVATFAAVAPLPLRVHETFPVKAKGAWTLTVAAASDLGCARKNNEDSFGVFRFDDAARGALLVLADGMGGAAAGEVASRVAVETVSDAYDRWKKKNQPREGLSWALSAANKAVHAQAQGDANLAGMGTTCTVAAIVGLDLTLGHVGDSRAYLVRRGTIEQMTHDHTLAGELARVANGRSVATPGGTSHVLTRCIGAQPEVQVDLSERPVHLEDGAIVVLCSDGLSNEVEPEEIRQLVTEHAPVEACDALIELARARGGPDNITVMVGRVDKQR
jgi:serine/threonine protein phosphatase PrpC